MAARVTRQEGDVDAADLAEEVGVAGRAERRLDGDLAGVLEQLVEPRTADDSDLAQNP